MKTIILLSTALLFLSSCTVQEHKFVPDESGAFYINRTDESFEVYSNKGVLILEFTSENTDLETLETLDYIYETVKEFYNKEYEQETDKAIRTLSI